MFGLKFLVQVTIVLFIFLSTRFLGSKKIGSDFYIGLITPVILLIFTYWLALDTAMVHVKDETGYTIFRVINFNLCAAATLNVFYYTFYGKPGLVFSRVLFIGSLICVIHVPFLSPDPFIDVYTILHEASDLLFSGKNPYNHTYPDIYGGVYTPLYGDPHLIYWPLNVYLLSIGKALFGDMRIIYVIALAITSLGVYRFAKNANIPPINALQYATLFLCFPVIFYELESAWIETLFFPFIVFFVIRLQQERFVSAGTFLGLICGIKQFAIFFLILSFIYVFKKHGFKNLKRMGIASAISFIVPMLPFLFDLKLFFQRTVFDVLAYKMRMDSFSWAPHLKEHFSIDLAGKMGLVIMLLALTLAIVFLVTRKKLSLYSLFGAFIFVYSIIFITAKQSFCNYYYFLSFIVLCFLVFHESEHRTLQKSQESKESQQL